MFRPQIQKTRILFILALTIMCMVYIAVNSYDRNPVFGFSLKSEALSKMKESIELLRKEFQSKGINSSKDSLSYASFLLGPKESSIQTTSGSIISKQSVLNPEFAAIIVEMLIELDIDLKKKVAVSYTGSYPGANLAVLSALEVMDIEAIITSSCGSSEYGATYPEYNWIDMENYLSRNDIFSNTSSMASIGGGADIGIQMSSKGREFCTNSIYNNKDLIFLNDENALENIEKRIDHYLSDDNMISVFINVGGGIYTVGDTLLRDNTPSGIIYPDDYFSKKDGVVLEYFLNMDIPVININQINILSELYDVPYPPTKKYKFGLGNLFYSKKQYNPIIILLTFFISSGLVLTIGIISHNEIKKRMNESEPESLL